MRVLSVLDGQKGGLHTVQVSNVSAKATEHDIQDFFSFSGEIEHNEFHKSRLLRSRKLRLYETALLLSGVTVVNQTMTIALADVLKRLARSVDIVSLQDPSIAEPIDATSTNPSVKSAQDVFQSMMAKGYVLGNNTMSKAKSFDEKHQLTSNTFQLAANTQAKVAEQKLNAADTAIVKNRYILIGTAWVEGACAKVAKTAEEVGEKTFERVATSGSSDQKSSGGPSSPSAPSPHAADDVDLSSKVSPPTEVDSNDRSQPEAVSKPAAST